MSVPQLFDRRLLRKRRDRIAEDFSSVRYLKDYVTAIVMERLSAINRTFNDVIDLGGGFEYPFSENTPNHTPHIISCDLSETFLKAQSSNNALVLDEEFLPFRECCSDLVLSTLSLHWVNDLPGTLAQIQRILKPDGLFMAAFLGGETLKELRDCLQAAELQLRGGVSPRFSPLISVRDAGALLQRAGFALPVVDHDLKTVTYPNFWDLLSDLKKMGETNCLYQRTGEFTSKSILDLACDLYHLKYGDTQGYIPATFDIIYMAGWAPHESQQKALKRGTAMKSLSEILT